MHIDICMAYNAFKLVVIGCNGIWRNVYCFLLVIQMLNDMLIVIKKGCLLALNVILGSPIIYK